MNETCCSFQVVGSLITNILSILFAFMGIVIISVSLAGVHPASEQCEQSKLFRPAEQYYYHRPLDNNDCSSTKAVLTVSFLKAACCFWKLELFPYLLKTFHSVWFDILGNKINIQITKVISLEFKV